MSNQEKNAPLGRQQGLLLLILAIGIVYVMWNVPQLSFVMVPLRLFVTYVHEAGHSIMALLTGGEVVGFQVNSDGSGLAVTRGGVRGLILPAGYIGAAFFGAALFYLVNTTRAARSIAITVGVGLILFSLFYAVPSDGFPLALLLGAGMGILLIVIGWKATTSATLIVLNVLAMLTALNAVLDLIYLTRNTSASLNTSRGIVRNDAVAFQQEVAGFLPASVWAFLWAGIAVILIALAVYYSVVRPLLRDTGDVVRTGASGLSGLSSLDPRPRKRDDKDK